MNEARKPKLTAGDFGIIVLVAVVAPSPAC
jgi:hypothetical protein